MHANMAAAELDVTIETLVRVREKKVLNYTSMLYSTFRKILEKQAYFDYRFSRDVFECKGISRDHPVRRQILRTADAVRKPTVCGEPRKAYAVVIQNAADGLLAKMAKGDKER